jgi:hypothetical protein
MLRSRRITPQNAAHITATVTEMNMNMPIPRPWLQYCAGYYRITSSGVIFDLVSIVFFFLARE